MNKEFKEIHLKVFLELLRTYHNGIGVSHGAEPQEDVARNLSIEANTITEAYLYSRISNDK
jgi:hypothetical protein